MVASYDLLPGNGVGPIFWKVRDRRRNRREGKTPDGWMDEDTTWYEVDLGPGHVVLDGVPALRKKGTAPSLFSANVYCGHGRLSQLLLSSSIIFPTISCPNVIPYAN